MKMIPQSRAKWTTETVREFFKENGLILEEDVYINYTTNMKCHDNEGYKYYTSLSIITSGRFPYKYHQSNPFTLENLQLFLKLHNSKSVITSTKYLGSKEKINIICECGNSYSVKPCDMTQYKKVYCNYCSKSKRYDGFRDYTEIISEECKKRGYELLTSYIHRSTDKFNYICLKHKDKGIQSSTYYLMIREKQGCKYCGYISRGIKHRKSESEYKELANQKGFDYVGVDYHTRSNGCKKATLHLVCRKHKDKGVQYIDYNNLKLNTGKCLYCCGRFRTKESFQKELDDLDLDLQIINFIDYTHLTVKCSICGYEWDTSGIVFTKGGGCPNCKRSSNEKYIEKWLKKLGLDFEIEYKFDGCRDINPLPFDFYLPFSNVAIEVDGEQHEKPVCFGGISKEKADDVFLRTVRHDNIKNMYCYNYGIPLIRISYSDINNGDAPYILFDELKKNGAII